MQGRNYWLGYSPPAVLALHKVIGLNACIHSSCINHCKAHLAMQTPVPFKLCEQVRL